MNRFTINGAANGENSSAPEDNPYIARRNTDKLGVVAVLVIAILLALNFMLRFAEVGAIVSKYNRF